MLSALDDVVRGGSHFVQVHTPVDLRPRVADH